jgi:hypothetical protein
MRPIFVLAAICFAASTASPVFAQAEHFNHLDCVYSEQKQDLVCPAVPGVIDGRSAAEPAAVVPAAPEAPARAGEVAQGSPEWNAGCAAKYKSFDAATGMYKGFSGAIKPCRFPD